MDKFDLELKGSAAIDEALAHVPRKKLPGVRRQLHRLNGNIEKALSPPNARKLLQHVPRRLKLYESIGFTGGMASDHYILGIVYSNAGNNTKAHKEVTDAFNLCEELGDRGGMHACLRGLATVQAKLGFLGSAEMDLLQALQLAEEENNGTLRANDLRNLGGLFTKIGDFPRARDYFKDALTIFQDAGLKRGVANCLHDIGNTYITYKFRGGDSEKALTFLRQARGMFEDEDVKDEIGAALCLLSIGNVYEDIDHAYALECLAQAHETLEKRKTEMGVGEMGVYVCLINMGNVHLAKDDNSDALECYDKAFAIARKLLDPQGVTTCLHNIGLVHIRQNKLDDAYRFLSTAISLHECWTGYSHTEREHQISFFEKLLNSYLTIIEKVLWPQNRYTDALEFAERAKARTLYDLLARAELVPGKGTPARLREAFTDLRRKERELFWLTQRHVEKKGNERDLLRRRRLLSLERASLLDRIKAHDPSFSEKVRTSTSKSEEIVQNVHKTDAAVIEFFLRRQNVGIHRER